MNEVVQLGRDLEENTPEVVWCDVVLWEDQDTFIAQRNSRQVSG